MSVVLITGCSSGIGLATALAFARGGMTTYATMRDLSKAEKLQNCADAEDLTLQILPLDVTDDASVEAAIRVIKEQHDGVDILVNNAGVGFNGPVETMPLERAHAVFETNVWGPIRLVRAVLPTMRERRSGVIVNVGSIVGRIPGWPHNGFYGASKHALSILTDALSWELAPFGVRMVIVEPEFYATELLHSGVAGSIVDGPYRDDQRWAADYALRACEQAGGDPADVAEAIVAAALAPDSPVHVPIGPGGPSLAKSATAVSSFEDWVKIVTQIMESLAGPRPNGSVARS
ncbi:SDR family oxidoreductase [Streptomyces sp. TG1A-8]|uniref:SDR family oxidoreductase n=1 Tax=Streptomyces sp. TG1A-8 TaxID=3051385 RepID=UPI00265B8ECE|nr:SDR family oxidoreductase [Streptomyces sp. TG1A-8]MDO0924116.1 SDR family oxidoreductase [Streptomyces sp. TG1A-8]